MDFFWVMADSDFFVDPSMRPLYWSFMPWRRSIVSSSAVPGGVCASWAATTASNSFAASAYREFTLGI